jgi:signal transduction histidine kinase/ActR/RegA family two-component response regulator
MALPNARPERRTGQTAPPSLAQLVMMTGPEVGRKYTIDFPAVLGRSDSATVTVEDDEVSRQHARILFLDGEFLIEDLGSRNGTFVGNEPVRTARLLHYGDCIALGPRVRLYFTQHDPQQDHILQRQRLEMMGRLAAGAAHDLNNTLCVALTSAEHLRACDGGRSLADAEIRECIADLLAALEHATHLTPALLELARSTPRRDALVDVGRLVREAASLVQRSLGRGIEVSCEAEHGLLVRGSAVGLHQVLLNLCLNARDAMPTGGHLRLHASSEQAGGQSRVVLSVSDDGCGMDEATRLQIFEPFFSTKREAGLGLGLATVRQVVSAHGGEVDVHSAPRRGTTFIVRLPRHVEHKVERQTIDDVRLPSPGSSILLVDDDAAIRRVVARLLKAEGYVVHTVSSGQEAIERVRVMRPDLLILDEELGDMTGTLVRRHLARERIALRMLRISGDASRLTGRHVIGKPWSTDALLGAVAEAITSKIEVILDDETDAPADSGPRLPGKARRPTGP